MRIRRRAEVGRLKRGHILLAIGGIVVMIGLVYAGGAIYYHQPVWRGPSLATHSADARSECMEIDRVTPRWETRRNGERTGRVDLLHWEEILIVRWSDGAHIPHGKTGLVRDNERFCKGAFSQDWYYLPTGHVMWGQCFSAQDGNCKPDPEPLPPDPSAQRPDPPGAEQPSRPFDP